MAYNFRLFRIFQYIIVSAIFVSCTSNETMGSKDSATSSGMKITDCHATQSSKTLKINYTVVNDQNRAAWLCIGVKNSRNPRLSYEQKTKNIFIVYGLGAARNDMVMDRLGPDCYERVPAKGSYKGSIEIALLNSHALYDNIILMQDYNYNDHGGKRGIKTLLRQWGLMAEVPMEDEKETSVTIKRKDVVLK